ATLAAFPELANVPAHSLESAIQVIGARDPQRAQAIRGHIERTSQLYQAHQQAAAQEQANLQQQQALWVKAQDSAYEAAVKGDTPEMKTKLAKEAIDMLKEYGASADEIRPAWNSPGLLRSAVGQRVLRDAAAYRMAKREGAKKVDRSAPPVMRPGVSQP